MKNGLNRFTFYLNQIELLLKNAAKEENPGHWLFKNNARTPFFMLEGLAKLYAGIQKHHSFNKIKDHFKLIEDALGQVDYYNWLNLAFETNEQIPLEIKQVIKNLLAQKLAILNEVLINKDWLANNNKKIKKITEKLNEINWLKPEEEQKAIIAFYNLSISEINSFVKETSYHFENVEKSVHELRRKLRWLSIYPQAMQGVFQYAEETTTAPHLEKYLTKEIVNSPFNILPAPGNNTAFVYLNKDYFLSLSWIISQLGSLKDEGLILTGLSEAIMQYTQCKKEDAFKEAYNMLGNKQRNLKEILLDAEIISKTYFEEKNLEHLISAI